VYGSEVKSHDIIKDVLRPDYTHTTHIHTSHSSRTFLHTRKFHFLSNLGHPLTILLDIKYAIGLLDASHLLFLPIL